MTAVPESWNELALVSITRADDISNELNAHAYTEDITGFDFGDKDIEGIALISGGRIAKPMPMSDESITMKVYPVNTNVADGGFAQLMHPQGDLIPGEDDQSEPFVVTNTTYRQKYRIIILWSTSLPSGSASALPALGEPAYRIQVINAYMTSYKPNYDDKIFSAEVTFKWTPFDRDGTGNKREESTTGATAQLAAATNSGTAWA